MNDPQAMAASQTTTQPTPEETLRKENSELFLEVRRQKALIEDLKGQIARYDASSLLSPSQAAANNEIAAQFYAMNNEQNEIAKVFRNEFADEIAAGKHNGSFSAIVIGYLREYKKLTARRRWLR